jgi:hypothetical protein
MSFPRFSQRHAGFVWRKPKEAYNPECLLSTVKHGGGNVTIWAATSWYYADPIVTMNGRIAASDYVDILHNQMRPVVHTLFRNNDAIFQDDISPIHTARSVQSWFEEHKEALHHLWSAQSPDLNIIKPLWSVLESRVRSRIPPPTSLKQLDVLHEK